MDDEKELPELELPNGNEKEGEPETTEEVENDQPEVDDEAEEEAEGSDVDEPEQVDAKSGRANNRVRSLANDRKAAREEAESAKAEARRLREQLDAVQRQMAGHRSEADLRAEAELLASMDPVQRVQYEADKKIENLQREIRGVQFAAADNNDKAMFLSKVANEPTRAKYVDKVEAALADMRAKGVNAPREDIYYYMLGKSFVETKGQGGNREADKKAAQKRVSVTQGKTTSIRSDAAGSRRGKSLEDRLANVLI